MRRLIHHCSLLLALHLLTSPLMGQLVSPYEFLAGEFGRNFTPHHRIVDYYERVAEDSPRARLESYGRTPEGRPLLLAFVSTPDNLERLEAIRENNLRAAGLLPGKPNPKLGGYAIVWLSFSVHGNEAAAAEASLDVLHRLADPANGRTGEWLKNTVVILDPVLNPDGHDRYVNWYRQRAVGPPDANPNAWEHREPWPGGRVNHYYFDLNRDWAWQTQVESRQRMVRYHAWMPHVHADFHEQEYTSPYYFAPAAAPYHEYITEWQADFQTEMGQNHARYFDREGWLYFTGERFDLLYPSYGDTYPTFNGAIGMTYEQGGHGRAGRAIALPNGDTLTLADRILHHRTTALSTVETASRESDRLTENFRRYFHEAATQPQGEYLTYVVSGQTPPGKMKRLLGLLDRNGIEYELAGASYSAEMYDYAHGETRVGNVSPGDLVISAFQPRSVLAQVLFDPTVALEDSVTYDITAWSVPFAYGLEAFASKERLELETRPGKPAAFESNLENEDLSDAYALVVPWTDLSSARFLGELLGTGLRARTAGGEFRFDDREFPAGTVVVTRADNRLRPDFAATVRRLADKHEVPVEVLTTGFSSGGGDLGNGDYALVNAPKIAVLAGEAVNANAFGQVWHYLERELTYPLSVFRTEDLDEVWGGDYNTLILPSGKYTLQKHRTALLNWVKAGNRLIALGQANAALGTLDGFSLEKDATKKREDTTKESRLLPYGGAERRFIGGYNPGAVVGVELDDTHPLSFGIGGRYYSLKTGTDAYAYLEKGNTVGRLREDAFVSGFIGAEARQKISETLIFGVQPLGKGSVVYLVDNPLYRGFWEEGKLLMANVLFQF